MKKMRKTNNRSSILSSWTLVFFMCFLSDTLWYYYRKQRGATAEANFCFTTSPKRSARDHHTDSRSHKFFKFFYFVLMYFHPVDTGWINAAFYTTQHMNSHQCRECLVHKIKIRKQKKKKKSVRKNEKWHEKKGRSERFHLKREHRSASHFDTVPTVLREKSVLLMWRDNCFANGDRAMRFACFR